MEPERIIVGTRQTWGGSDHLFGLSPADRRQHLYILGQTGTGKSSLLRELIRQDLESGQGLALIDPHGDLADSVLDCVPQARINSVRVIEPAELARAVALNPFYRVPENDRALVASNLVAAFRHLWRDSWAPVGILLSNTFAAILDAPDHLRPTFLLCPAYAR